ncbi:uncharacterized protein LOC130685674 [Daphnia carinata]|uniref:uncharacterized protein LOC130685674 n=1 Tax=Daphnia carinata TaxID=120202 RepID=UPI00257F8E11|nr:uncharacterized protein LOC130685674 [Daphnia carinata]
MADGLVHWIVLAFCLTRLSGEIQAFDEIMTSQQEKHGDKLETATTTGVNIGRVDILPTSSTTREGTTTKSHNLMALLNPSSTTWARSDETAGPTAQTVIVSVTGAAVTATLNGTELADATQWTPIATQLPSTTKSITSSEMTATVRTYADAESSAESFDSAEFLSSTPFPVTTSVSKLAPFPTLPSRPSTADAKNNNVLPSATLSPFWPWMLFIINGNATVANRRQRDLGTYLRLNLAARLDADYNDVAINRILLTPQAILANISVEPSHLVYGGTGAAGLEALGQGNVTLLELSGHEFQVDRIIRFDEIVDQRGMISSMEMSSMVATVGSEVTVYGAVGAVFLFLLVALLLGLSFSSPCKAGDNSKYLSSNNLGYDRDQMDSNYSDGFTEWNLSTMELMPDPPPVIYTEQLARDIEGDAVLQCKHPSHFIPLTSRRMSLPNVTIGEFHHHQRNHPSDELLIFHHTDNSPSQCSA